jgi:hypothetical protein
MSRLDEVWAEFAHVPWPADIGDTVLGVRIGELDDDVLAVLSSYRGMGADLGQWRVAELGLALGELVRIVPNVASPELRRYVTQLADVARAALEDMARGDVWASASDE